MSTSPPSQRHRVRVKHNHVVQEVAVHDTALDQRLSELPEVDGHPGRQVVPGRDAHDGLGAKHHLWALFLFGLSEGMSRRLWFVRRFRHQLIPRSRHRIAWGLKGAFGSATQKN
jgi:hypothetical protein